MAPKTSILNIGVLIFLSVATSFIIVYLIAVQILRVQNEAGIYPDNTQQAEPEVSIDEPEKIDLAIFAPFYYWKNSENGYLTLTRYFSNEKEIEYPEIKQALKKPTDRKIENDVEEVKASNDGKLVALVRNVLVQGKIDDTIQVYDTENDSLTDYSVSPEIYDFGTHSLNFSTWSPDDRYLYFLYSSENERDHNIRIIDTNQKTSRVLLNGYDINIIGWLNNRKLAYYINPREFGGGLEIKSIDVTNGSVEEIGFCPNVWFNQCVSSLHSMPGDNLLFSASPNSTRIFVYNFKDRTGKELADIMKNKEFGRANILGFSPDKTYMYFGIFQSHTNRQPEESGTYEYNLHGDSFRHISQKEFSVVAWDKVTKGSVILFREEGRDAYYLHLCCPRG